MPVRKIRKITLYYFGVIIEKIEKITSVWVKIFLTSIGCQASHAGQENQKKVLYYFGLMIEKTDKINPVRVKIFITSIGGQVSHAVSGKKKKKHYTTLV